MRYAADQKEKTRSRIVRAAGKVFRREGYHAAGVDKVMAEAGLTAGGFYAHFDSKQALLAEAIEDAAVEVGEGLAQATENLAGRKWIEAFLSRYLNRAHCEGLEGGCPLAALVSEIARAGEPVKERFEAVVRALVSEVASHASGCGSTRADERALAAVAMCLGGLALARSVRGTAYAEQILESCGRAALEIVCPPEKRRRTAPPRRRGKAS